MKILKAALLISLLACAAYSVTDASAERPIKRIIENIRERRQEQQTGGASPADAVKSGSQVITLTVAGKPRTFIVHAPKSAGGKSPVVFSLHGLGESSERQESLSGFSTLADQKGFIAVYPQGLSNKWRSFGKSEEDLNFIRAIVAYLKKNYSVDEKRIYANGISNGAQMSYMLACNAPELFAAFGFVAGGYVSNCPAKVHRPVIIFHGTVDKLLPYEGRARQMGPRDFALGWAARPNCRLNPSGEVIYQKGDITGERWSCAPNGEVELYTAKDKGHSWPGSGMPANITSKDIDASAAMWEFFSRYSL